MSTDVPPFLLVDDYASDTVSVAHFDKVTILPVQKRVFPVTCWQR